MSDIDYKFEAELAFFKHYVSNIYPSGVVSYVSDTFDFFRVITEIAPRCKDEIMNRQPNAVGLAKTVFRPDSGDPVKILSGYETIEKTFESVEEYFEYALSNLDELLKAEAIMINGAWFVNCSLNFLTGEGERLSESEVKGAVECLWEIFGGTVTDKGYKLLDSHVGLIYGDSITLERAEQIMERLAAKGFASANVVFGIGSYTYQYSTRDSFGQAMKATYAVVNGEGRELFKDPVTDSGTKKSAKGLLKVSLDSEGKYFLEDQVTPEQEAEGCLRTVYKDGNLLVDESLDEIRQRLNAEVQKQVEKMKSKA